MFVKQNSENVIHVKSYMKCEKQSSICLKNDGIMRYFDATLIFNSRIFSYKHLNFILEYNFYESFSHLKL